MRYVDLRYPVPRGNFDAVVDMLVSLRNGRDLVNGYFSKKDISCSIGGNEFAAGLEIPVVFLARHEGEKFFWESLYFYFSFAGFPSYVANYSDFDACEKALAPFHKTLRRKIRGGLFGKAVVDV